MRVKELISELSKFDEDLEVKIKTDDNYCDGIYYYDNIVNVQKEEKDNWIVLRNY